MFALPSSTVPGFVPPADDGRVVRRDEARQHARAAGREDPVGAEDVLVHDRHAGERATLALREPLVRRPCIGERPVCRDGHERVERRAQPLDAAQQVQREFETRELPGAQARGQVRYGQGVHGGGI
jgi:hypothetical protein